MSFLDKAGFNKRERSGLILILVLAFIGFVTVFVLKKNEYSSRLTEVDPNKISIIDSLLNQDDIESKGKPAWKKNKPSFKNSSKRKFSNFNPNSYSKEDWIYFGFSDKQAASLLKYKSKINGFKSKQDLKDAFVVNDFMYEKMEPLLFFDTLGIAFRKTEKTNYPIEFNESRDQSTIDINSANAKEFKTLYGIGEKLAGRIVKFRDLLGGFYAKQQVREVYGISDSLYDSFENRLVIEDLSLKKLKINELSEKELKAHPYIDWKKAKSIINYRKDWAKIRGWSVLLKEGLLTEADRSKLEPYLSFE